ncbi:hypothetical protein [Demequina sp.]|uniref:tetratricopeptide repeat protein n=1 Tax=Demequina sp. TaxID=2050685 RepID=UPI0025C0536D|nr:hypothetical protein [Demequina sp.]
MSYENRSELDLLELLVRLRMVVPGPRRAFDAFDVALATAWSRFRPGVPLVPSLTSADRSIVENIVRAVNGFVGASIELSLEGPADSPFGIDPSANVGVSVSHVLAVCAERVMREHRDRRRDGRKCSANPSLGPFLDWVEDGSSQFDLVALAQVLEWDLENAGEAVPITVCFLDAIEGVLGTTARGEELLKELLEALPSIFWVLASKRQPSWGLTPRRELPSRSAWSTGRQGVPQIRVDGFDARQESEYVRLVVEDMPDLSLDAIERVVRAAEGWPLHLGLGIKLARQYHATTSADLAEVSLDFGDVVRRLLHHLDPDVAELVRLAAVAGRFSPDLIQLASGCSAGAVSRLVADPLVQEPVAGIFPLRLHAATRGAVLEEDRALPGAWVHQDRVDAAGRLVDVLGGDRFVGLDIVAARDRVHLAAELCESYDLEPTWLVDALLKTPAFVSLRVPYRDRGGRWIDHVGEFFAIYQDPSKVERISLVKRFLSDDSRPEAIVRFAELRLGYMLKGRDWPVALEIFQRRHRASPTDRGLQYQVAYALLQLERSDDLWTFLETTDDRDENRLIYADIAMAQGRPAEAARIRRIQAERHRDSHHHRLFQENLSSAVLAEALAGRGTAEGRARDVDALRSAASSSVRSGLCAQAVARDQGCEDALAKARSLYSPHSDVQPIVLWLAEAIVGLRDGDSGLLQRVADEAYHPRWEPLAPSTRAVVLDQVLGMAGHGRRYHHRDLGRFGSVQQAEANWKRVLKRLIGA